MEVEGRVENDIKWTGSGWWGPGVRVRVWRGRELEEMTGKGGTFHSEVET